MIGSHICKTSFYNCTLHNRKISCYVTYNLEQVRSKILMNVTPKDMTYYTNLEIRINQINLQPHSD